MSDDKTLSGLTSGGAWINSDSHLLDYILAAQHSVILAGTSTYDATGDIQDSIEGVPVNGGRVCSAWAIPVLEYDHDRRWLLARQVYDVHYCDFARSGAFDIWWQKGTVGNSSAPWRGCDGNQLHGLDAVYEPVGVACE